VKNKQSVAGPSGRASRWKSFARVRWLDPRMLTCGAIPFGITTGSKEWKAARSPRGQRFGFAATATWAILGRSETPAAKFGFNFAILIRPSSGILRMTSSGWSLASAARGSDLPGLTTVRMLERILSDYHGAFAHDFDEDRDLKEPEPVRSVAKKAAAASWKSLAAEDLEGTSPTLPIGIWPSPCRRGAISKGSWRIGEPAGLTKLLFDAQRP
jgi:hypothetical protein